jgi:hypothetical protein
MTTTRDKIANYLSNLILRVLATEEYRERLEYTYVRGLMAMAEDTENRR